MWPNSSACPAIRRASPHTATNKFMMRQHSQLSGIACPWYRRVRSTADGTAAIDDVMLPAIVKPVDNCSSRGVRWIGRKSDLAAAVFRGAWRSRAVARR